MAEERIPGFGDVSEARLPEKPSAGTRDAESAAPVENREPEVRNLRVEDHYIYVDGELEAILLSGWYPDELSRERAARAFRRANLGRRVEVRRR